MSRPTDGRKNENVNIPVTPAMKTRLNRVAKKKKERPTEVARTYLVAGIETDEQQFAAASK